MQKELNNALEILNKGGIIIYPTDTIWGIGCDATNSEAVDKIYKIKQRKDSKSLLVLLDSPSRLYQYINEIPDVAWEIIEVADKPLTIIYPGAKNLAVNLLAEDGSIGIRIVKDDFCERLIQRFKKPLVSTSANISGEPAPSTFYDIPNTILNKVDYVVNWRQEESTPSKPSGIIKLGIHGEVKVIRE